MSLCSTLEAHEQFRRHSLVVIQKLMSTRFILWLDGDWSGNINHVANIFHMHG